MQNERFVTKLHLSHNRNCKTLAHRRWKTSLILLTLTKLIFNLKNKAKVPAVHVSFAINIMNIVTLLLIP